MTRVPGASASTTDQERGQAATFVLEVVQVFGAEASDAKSGGQKDRGDMLAAIAGIAEGRNGDVYVLDQGFKRISVFAANGVLRRVVLGGQGRGPGEFVMPTAMDLTTDGRLAVFDYGLNRVSFFDTSGTFVRSIVVDRAKDIVVVGDTIWGSGMPGREFMLWARTGSAGVRISAIEVDKAHEQFTPRGAIARLGRGEGRHLLVADDRPGIWYTRSNGVFIRRGSERFPGAKYENVGGIPVPPAATIGIAHLEGGRVAIAYGKTTFAGNRAGPPRNAYFIGVFDREGKLLGEVALGSDRAVFSGSPDGRHVYMSRYDPFPQVVRYRVAAVTAREAP